jgi:serine/threonine-protein kinase
MGLGPSDPSEAGAGVRAGEILAGKYRVDRVLGVGGMGVVVAAHHLQLDERVAIKFLLPQALKNPQAIARFLREARAAVKIKSEHVARVTDVGQLENGLPYMVMEYLDGGDLATWLKRWGPMPVDQAVDFVLQAGEAIAEAHALGIVHRDLKPANLFCVRRADGQLAIKVLDFGISKVTTPNEQKHDMTHTSTIVGSPSYMSPEQLQSSKGVDPRSDVWSLGIILFELVTGQVPFVAEAMTELVIKIATEPPIPLSHVRTDLPLGLESLVLRCLEKDRGRRFQSVGELAIALRDYAPRHAWPSVERILRTVQRAGMSTTTLLSAHSSQDALPLTAPSTIPPWGRTGQKVSRRGRAVAVMGTALAVALCAVFAVALFRRAPRRSVPLSSAASIPSVSVSSSPPEPAISLSQPAPAASSAPPLDPSAPPATASHGVAHRPLPAPPPAPTPAAPRPKRDCDPPYTLDDQGRKHFKPECYLQGSP